MPGVRYALAYTPPPDSPLARFGAGILGYDCFEAAEVPRLAVDGIGSPILQLLTVEPRRYGFNACFVSSFALAHDSEASLCAEVESFAKRHATIPVGTLAVHHRLDDFIVLRAQPNAQLRDFITACLAVFRASGSEPDAADPHAMAQLSMPLLGPVPKDAAPDLTNHLSQAFSKFAGDHVEVGSISLMRQDNPDARFRVLTCMRLTGR